MKNFEIIYEGNHIVTYNKLLFKTFPLELFDPHYLNANKLSRKKNTAQLGRGAVHYFEFEDKQLVLRHYHRGGVPAKIIDDQYLWTGFGAVRAIQELHILSALHEKGLSVPLPAAAHIHKRGLRYRADIVTGLIPNAKTLGAKLLEKPLSESAWSKIGKIIKEFHNHNCNHADLNAHNILFDEFGNVYLIDFDKSKIDHTRSRWKENNLMRLRRSLEKLASHDKSFNYNSENFTALIEGYTNDDQS